MSPLPSSVTLLLAAVPAVVPVPGPVLELVLVVAVVAVVVLEPALLLPVLLPAPCLLWVPPCPCCGQPAPSRNLPCGARPSIHPCSCLAQPCLRLSPLAVPGHSLLPRGHQLDLALAGCGCGVRAGGCGRQLDSLVK